MYESYTTNFTKVRDYFTIYQSVFKKSFPNLDLKDVSLFDYLSRLFHIGKGNKKTLKTKRNVKIFYPVDYNKLIEAMPLLGISNVDALRRRFNKLVSAGILERHPDNKANSTAYYAFTDKKVEIDSLIKDDSPAACYRSLKVLQRAIVFYYPTLLLKDAAILRFFYDVANRPTNHKKQHDGDVYSWVNIETVFNSLPLLNYNHKNRIYERVNIYCQLGLMKRHHDNKATGKTYFCLSEDFYKIMEGDSFKLALDIQRKQAIQFKDTDLKPFRTPTQNHDADRPKTMTKAKPLKLSIKANNITNPTNFCQNLATDCNPVLVSEKVGLENDTLETGVNVSDCKKHTPKEGLIGSSAAQQDAHETVKETPKVPLIQQCMELFLEWHENQFNVPFILTDRNKSKGITGNKGKEYKGMKGLLNLLRDGVARSKGVSPEEISEERVLAALANFLKIAVELGDSFIIKKISPHFLSLNFEEILTNHRKKAASQPRTKDYLPAEAIAENKVNPQNFAPLYIQFMTLLSCHTPLRNQVISQNNFNAIWTGSKCAYMRTVPAEQKMKVITRAVIGMTRDDKTLDKILKESGVFWFKIAKAITAKYASVKR